MKTIFPKLAFEHMEQLVIRQHFETEIGVNEHLFAGWDLKTDDHGCVARMRDQDILDLFQCTVVEFRRRHMNAQPLREKLRSVGQRIYFVSDQFRLIFLFRNLSANENGRILNDI